jgi:hypothetical protein
MEQQQPQINQRCHFTGIGFGTIRKIVERNGVTELQIRFDAGVTRWKKLDEVELIDLPQPA